MKAWTKQKKNVLIAQSLKHANKSVERIALESKTLPRGPANKYESAQRIIEKSTFCQNQANYSRGVIDARAGTVLPPDPRRGN